jgi:3-hydroxymyristoyl/3-hydroxydecanoyl-(acyl carrier protein) dehydratase
MFPGCIVLKNDPNYLQGIPDLTIFWHDRWATLEVKKAANASHQANQDYYVSKMDQMSFSRFIYPENKKEVLHELQQSFRP